MQSLEVNCRVCDKPRKLEVNQADYDAWRDGQLIQNVMPYLSADDRELLISETCGDCFRSMFAEIEKPTDGNQ